MKIFPTILLLLIFSTGNAQDDFYVLVKNGKEYVKPVYYLSDSNFQKVVEINNCIIFEYTRNRFLHNPEQHAFREIKKQFVDTLKLIKPEVLFQLEEEEFNQRANEILEISGFKPPPPISHRILKIFVLRQKKESYFIYEVEWISF